MIYSSYFFEPALFEQQPKSDPAMAMIGAHLLIVGHQSLSICSAVNQRKSIGGLLIHRLCQFVDKTLIDSGSSQPQSNPKQLPKGTL